PSHGREIRDGDPERQRPLRSSRTGDRGCPARRLGALLVPGRALALAGRLAARGPADPAAVAASRADGRRGEASPPRRRTARRFSGERTRTAAAIEVGAGLRHEKKIGFGRESLLSSGRLPKPSTPSNPRLIMRRLLLPLSIAITFAALPTAAQPKKEQRFLDPINVKVPHISTDKTVKYDYDIVYVRAKRAGDKVHKRFYTDFSAPVTLEPGADLMLLHPSGKE